MNCTTQKLDYGSRFKTYPHTHPSRVTTGQNGHPLGREKRNRKPKTETRKPKPETETETENRKRKPKIENESETLMGARCVRRVGSPPATLNLDAFPMSDEEHDVETFDTADAGASHTIPMQAGSVRKGGFMVRSRATSDERRATSGGTSGVDAMRCDAADRSRDARAFARRETDTARTIGNGDDANGWRLF